MLVKQVIWARRIEQQGPLENGQQALRDINKADVFTIPEIPKGHNNIWTANSSRTVDIVIVKARKSQPVATDYYFWLDETKTKEEAGDRWFKIRWGDDWKRRTIEMACPFIYANQRLDWHKSVKDLGLDHWDVVRNCAFYDG